MRERIRQLDGQTQIHSDKTGTKIDVTLPAKTETGGGDRLLTLGVFRFVDERGDVVMQ